LGALDHEGADVLVVASGVDPSPYARTGVEVVHEPVPGLSAARNRALAACPEDGVVAYLDDDAEVDPGWLEAMTAAWAAAGPRVGCIGGPIRARFPGGRPDWLGPAIEPMLTTLDLGPAPRDLDPDRQAVFGANMAFRVAALREAGGFDPAWGHTGRTTWFGEDDEAQLALVRRGWTVRYEPGPSVVHVIDPARATIRGLLRRRYAHGRAVARRGRRDRATAARWLASNAAGAPVALARGDRARAMERALYAAENLGVLRA
jgi:cellulose synthase/poly-beta-1,6-N-acetylglucosamine synthase-like glycosyltransferase